jgi:hypothetical protein
MNFNDWVRPEVAHKRAKAPIIYINTRTQLAIPTAVLQVRPLVAPKKLTRKPNSIQEKDHPRGRIPSATIGGPKPDESPAEISQVRKDKN